MRKLEREQKESGRQAMARNKANEQDTRKREKEIEAQCRKTKTTKALIRSSAALNLRWGHGENNEENDVASQMKQTVSGFCGRGSRN